MDFIFGFFKTINAIKVKKAVDMVAVFVQIIEFDEFSAKIRLLTENSDASMEFWKLGVLYIVAIIKNSVHFSTSEYN